MTKVNNHGEQKKGTTETEVNDLGVNESSAFWRGLNGLCHENIAVLGQFYARARCWSHYLVPLLKHKMLPEQDIKQISSVSTNHNFFLVIFAGTATKT